MADTCFWTDFIACAEACVDHPPPSIVTPGFNFFGANFMQMQSPYATCTLSTVRSSGGADAPDVMGETSSTLVVPRTPLFTGGDYLQSYNVNDPLSSAGQQLNMVFPLRAVKGDFVQGGITYQRPPVFGGGGGTRYLVAELHLSDVLTHLTGVYYNVGMGTDFYLYGREADALAGNGAYFGHFPGIVFPNTKPGNAINPLFVHALWDVALPSSGPGEVWGRLACGISATSWQRNVTPSVQLLSVSFSLRVAC